MEELTDNVRERTFEVDQNFEGWRLDRFLANRLGRVSRSRAGDIARHGDVSIVPARKVKAGTRLRAGDVVTLREHLPPERVQYDEVAILYEDDDLIVLDKPSGMLVHETSTTRLNTVQAYFARRGPSGAEAVHRIDRETSGVLVCAARRELVPSLRELFSTDHPEKTYRALVVDGDGRWQEGARATLTTPLSLDTESRLGLRMIPGEREATTHVRVAGRTGGLADLVVRIETGRQHQIRAHLALEGTPVAGDKLYTYDDQFFMDLHDNPDDAELLSRLRFDRHALHAWRIALPHPTTGDVVAVESDLPNLWRDEAVNAT